MSKEIKGYIVGREWFSQDQGELPNNFTTIVQIYSDFDHTVTKYESEHAKDKSWGFGHDWTYVCPIFSDGTVGENYFNIDTLFFDTEWRVSVEYNYYGVIPVDELITKVRTKAAAEKSVENFLIDEKIKADRYALQFDRNKYKISIKHCMKEQ